MPYNVQPNGVTRDTLRRVAVYTDPRQIRCPACETSVSRFTARPGEAFLTCENMVRVAASNRKRPCGQHLYVLMAPARLIVVVTITREEFDLTAPCTDESARLLHQLGILPAAYSALAAAKVA